MICCFALGQSVFPMKSEVEKAIWLTISQKITQDHPGCEYGRCGEWWAANNDSLFYRSDTVKFYNSSNIADTDPAFCNSIVWVFKNTNSFFLRKAQRCQEPPTISVNVNGRNAEETESFLLISQNDATYIVINEERLDRIKYKVIGLVKFNQKDAGTGTFCITLAREK